MEDLKILTESVCCIAREAGYFLKEERKNFSREAVQKKQAHKSGNCTFQHLTGCIHQEKSPVYTRQPFQGHNI